MSQIKPIFFDGNSSSKDPMRFFTYLSKVCGIFPPFSANFKWKSWNSVNYAFTLGATLILIGSSFFSTLKLDAIKLGYIINYYVTVLVFILLLERVMHSSLLTEQWHKINTKMNVKYGYPKEIDLIIILFIVLLPVLLLVEGAIGFYETSSALSEMYARNFTLKMYFETTYPEIFNYVPYNALLAFLYMIIVFRYSTFKVILELYLMIIGITVSTRFKQITTYMKNARKKKISNSNLFWSEIRDDYCQLADLVFALDEHFSHIILIIYTYIVLYMLERVTYFLSGWKNAMNTGMICFSTIHAFGRLTCITLFNSWINDESKTPAQILHSLSEEDYNTEVRRWLLQISFDEIALTGSKMFKINRKLLLSVVSAIVTYELIIIQYNTT